MSPRASLAPLDTDRLALRAQLEQLVAPRPRLTPMHTFLYKTFMTRRYSIAQARATLPTIVDQVDRQGPVEITRRGKPVAVMLSLSQYERLTTTRPTFSEAFALFRQAHDLTEHGLEGEFSPRQTSPGRMVEL